MKITFFSQGMSNVWKPVQGWGRVNPLSINV